MEDALTAAALATATDALTAHLAARLAPLTVSLATSTGLLGYNTTDSLSHFLLMGPKIRTQRGRERAGLRGPPVGGTSDRSAGL